jgi:hypothetical protein
VASRTRDATVTDARGRTIVVRSFSALEAIQFARIIGADNARNEVYLAMASKAAMVRAIDEEKYRSIPQSIVQIESRYALLDIDGVEAIDKVVIEWAREDAEAFVRLKDDAKN